MLVCHGTVVPSSLLIWVSTGTISRSGAFAEANEVYLTMKRHKTDKVKTMAMVEDERVVDASKFCKIKAESAIYTIPDMNMINNVVFDVG